MALKWYIAILLVFITSCKNNNQQLEGIKYANALRSHLAKPKGTVKTIRGEYGDVVDCVDIYQQPAFTNPLLKNHSLQLRPSLVLHPTNEEDKSSSILVQSWSCPKGTVPIKRPSKIDFIASELRKTFPLNGSKVNTQETHKYAVVDHKHSTADIHGISAIINIWKPDTEPKDFSLAQVWIVNDLVNQRETLEAGWMVYPNLFGTHDTILFVFYTNDNYKTPCYNLDCKGFIEVDPSVKVGSQVLPPSVYDGAQTEMSITIAQDLETKNWWFYFQNQAVGYWPAILFKGLSAGANRVQWGGEIAEAPTSNHPTSTHMGSGHFPGETINKVAYFKNILYLDANHKKVLPDPNMVNYIISRPECYTMTKIGNDKGSVFFFFGGPGRSEKCK